MYPGKDDGVLLDRERFVKLLESYYELSGWEVATGWPGQARLEELGLGDVADDLERLGKRDQGAYAPAAYPLGQRQEGTS
jgi:hypothetical protein